MTTESDRVAGFGKLEDGLKQASPWYTWGPYVSERQWGTVREDYSEDGDAWNYLPFDHARSRVPISFSPGGPPSGAPNVHLCPSVLSVAHSRVVGVREDRVLRGWE